MRFRSLATVMAFLMCGAEAAPAWAGQPETFRAMVDCKTNFFDRLSADNSQFPVSGIKETSSPVTKAHVGVIDAEATFVKPVVVGDLHLISFGETTWLPTKRPTRFMWNFTVAESTDTVAAAIKALVKDADFEQRDDQYGWVQDLDPVWRHLTPGTSIETQEPTRMLLVKPTGDGKPGSTITCMALAPMMKPMKALPKLTELFTIAVAPSP